jgi:hypothetical protein
MKTSAAQPKSRYQIVAADSSDDVALD